MMLKVCSKSLGVMLVVAIAPAAFAAAPVKLDCPEGTRQAGGSGGKVDILACVKTSSKEFSPHGPTVYLYPNGAKQAEGMSKDGFRMGLWTFYDEQGRKTGTAMFKDSNFHGEVTELYPDGKVRKVETYAEGLRHGMVKEFSADGKVVKQVEYRNNREVTAK